MHWLKARSAILKEMKRQKLTRYRLAVICGLTHETAKHALTSKGIKGPTVKTLSAILGGLGKDYAWLEEAAGVKRKKPAAV